MKLKYRFETMELDGKVMAVAMDTAPGEDRIMLRMNVTGAEILQLLREDTDEAAIIAALLQHYAVEEDELRRRVQSTIEMLRGSGLLTE